MSREAQASREKEARIILGQAEVEIAHLFEQASHSYERNPTALHLRAMNILYEGLKEKGALMLVPSTAVESMGLGGMLGAAALRQQMLSQGEPQPPGRMARSSERHPGPGKGSKIADQSAFPGTNSS